MNSTQPHHCMVVHAYYPLGETRVEREALTLKDRGFRVDVICLRGEEEPAIAYIDGVKVYRMPIKRRRGSGPIAQLLEYLSFFVFSFIHLSKLHLKERYDLVQIHNLPDFLVFSALIPKWTGAKIVLDIHDLMPEFFAERFYQEMDTLAFRLLALQEKFACAFADKVITVTETWRKTLISRGIPPEKVFVVMNLADKRYFYRNGIEPKSNGNRLELIYHGVFGHRHGLDLLLSAIDKIRETVPDIHLTLHGEGEYRKTLEEMVCELGLEEYVSFSDHFIPTQDLVELIRSADLGIVPYRNGVFTGGILPTKLMEYAALGLPVVVSRTPSINEYFDETMVEFFPPGDVDLLAESILKVASDRKKLAELANNITRFNTLYNWQEQSASYLTSMEELIRQ
jgi:glycosyltransferase involved in cell wall biosynthesis